MSPSLCGSLIDINILRLLEQLVDVVSSVVTTIISAGRVLTRGYQEVNFSQSESMWGDKWPITGLQLVKTIIISLDITMGLLNDQLFTFHHSYLKLAKYFRLFPWLPSARSMCSHFIKPLCLVNATCLFFSI